ncbi:MAG: hypothetical protein DRH12_16460 [Deltaproteobacteria bacterium]|nr:MAG: hypothetical protein DRH12_16460 [Deltaproteobacteria bacterium]
MARISLPPRTTVVGREKENMSEALFETIDGTIGDTRGSQSCLIFEQSMCQVLGLLPYFHQHGIVQEIAC